MYYSLSSFHRRCNQLYIFTLNWATYWNKIIVWIISVIYIHQSYNELEILRSNSAKHLNTVVVWIPGLLCSRRSPDPLKIYSAKCATYLNKIFLWDIHFIFVHRSRDHCKFILKNERTIRIKSYYELSTWSIFKDHAIYSKSMLRSERNIRRRS
jgi:hypothetical protein